jgi:hypothetical protein
MFDLFFGLAFWLCATIFSKLFGSSESNVFGGFTALQIRPHKYFLVRVFSKKRDLVVTGAGLAPAISAL